MGATPQLFYIDAVNPSGQLFAAANFNSTDTATAEWQTRWFDFGEDTYEKLVYQIEVIHRGALTLTYEIDNDEATGIAVRNSLFADNQKLQPSIFETEIYGRSFRFRFIASSRGVDKYQDAPWGFGGLMRFKRYEAAISRIHIRARRLGDRHR
jgi:hypothetical protein